MTIAERLDLLHQKLRSNKWRDYFAVFLRIVLAWGFLPSGIVKILGDRFTVLTTMHPMGHYLDAVYRTGFYYTLLGVGQVTAAILLLIPRTTLIGALLYFPIIINICLVSISVRFEGSLVTSPLMAMACGYLLCWDYHRLKFIFPWHHGTARRMLPVQQKRTRFPFAFFGTVLAIIVITGALALKGFDIKPRNTMKDCMGDCPGNKDPHACAVFCDCIHKQGQSLDSCLKLYYKSARQEK